MRSTPSNWAGSSCSGGAEGLLDVVQDLPQRQQQGLRPGGGFHALGSADQQGIVIEQTQAGQCPADGRLAHGEPFGGLGGVALLQQCLEHHQQVEVDAS